MTVLRRIAGRFLGGADDRECTGGDGGAAEEADESAGRGPGLVHEQGVRRAAAARADLHGPPSAFQGAPALLSWTASCTHLLAALKACLCYVQRLISPLQAGHEDCAGIA